MQLKDELIKLLADGKCHSGESLGNKLHVSRSAIWKAIQEFSELGIDVLSIKGKGYQIPKGLELLDLDTIQGHLSSSLLRHLNLEILSNVNSTNQFLSDNLHSKPSGTIVLAEHQTNGRGRRQRAWLSPFGTNLYFSMLWSFDQDPSELYGLSLATGIAVTNTLERYGISNIQLKWPNDVLYNYKKLAGILIEMSGETHSTTQVIIGIGLNLQMPNSITINQDWTDVASITGHKSERNRLAAMLIEEVYEMLIQFQQKGFAKFYKHWLMLDAFYDKPVELITPTQVCAGIGKGINRQGEYILLSEDNKEMRFFHGEVSLRRV